MARDHEESAYFKHMIINVEFYTHMFRYASHVARNIILCHLTLPYLC